MRLVLSTTLCVAATGCYSTHIARHSAEAIIWTPRTVYGRAVLKKLHDDFVQLIQDIQASPELRGRVMLKRNGLMVGNRPESKPDANYIGLYLTYPVTYNTLQTSYLFRAASSYSQTLFPLSKIICRHPALFEDKRIVGVCIRLEWKATNFVSDKYRLSAKTEVMNAWIPREALEDFATTRISIQELGRRSVFTSSLGRTELDFMETVP
ncbi:hypothetical protein CH330_03985 [candidate division WOR-3 bacterium JGI_Cruoil_03_51_56]|uniref:Uncharacterized protein n=1 Tax=candidate division WOR-3 bacterium JGI_Cruoil_03_51_56 TaxID=1973747 RepID=A0A235BV68_UNCW3|nr:MAG: hypothetical protein CH330_03985 [candidate division WOR-3 bacterium JGI_Cruoil_03_51_56]